MIQVQLPLDGLDNGREEDTETVNDGVLVYPTQKFFRVLILLRKDGGEYRGIEIEADLGRWSSNGQHGVDCEAREAQTDPDPCDVRVCVDALIGHRLMCPLGNGVTAVRGEKGRCRKATHRRTRLQLYHRFAPERTHGTASDFMPRVIRKSNGRNKAWEGGRNTHCGHGVALRDT